MFFLYFVLGLFSGYLAGILGVGAGVFALQLSHHEYVHVALVPSLCSVLSSSSLLCKKTRGGAG